MSLLAALTRRFLTITLVYALALSGVLLAPSRATGTAPAYDLLSVICAPSGKAQPEAPQDTPHQHCDLCVLCAAASALPGPALPPATVVLAAPHAAPLAVIWHQPAQHPASGWISSRTARGPPLPV